jgi:uncharacterized protein YbcI
MYRGVLQGFLQPWCYKGENPTNDHIDGSAIRLGSPELRLMETTKQTHGDVLTAISDGLVGLLKEFYGHGPTRVKSYYEDDLVVCVLRGGFSRVEQTLLDGGRGSAVIQQRMEFQEVMRDRFTEVIEHATGRTVIGFMSGNQQHPDLMCEVFILGPTDLLDDHEWGDASGGSSLTA